MGDSIPAALALIDDRLDELRASMTDEPIDVVTKRYLAWKSATAEALAAIVVESVVSRFEAVRGSAGRRDGRRPTPQIYLDGAAARAFLRGLKEELALGPAAVLRRPPTEPMSARDIGLRTIVDLLERRLPGAFRGGPEDEGNLRDGFETLLAGSGIAYERAGDAIAAPSGNVVPDFAFPDLQAALRMKLCHRPGREKEIAAEIEEETAAGRARYPRMVFAVYDLGFIRDVGQFSKRFEGRDAVRVVVLTG
jgi:hypothetical protein